MYEVTAIESSRVDIERVISVHKEYIENTTRGPLSSKTPEKDLGQLIGEDEQKVCNISLDGLMNGWMD